MNELNELRDQAYENSLIYKEKTKKIHDSKIKNRVFNVGDQVLLFNTSIIDFLGHAQNPLTEPISPLLKIFPYETLRDISNRRTKICKARDIEEARLFLSSRFRVFVFIIIQGFPEFEDSRARG
ncbi:hypothetical protein Tco_1395841 [Tanacetum coccineum]